MIERQNVERAVISSRHQTGPLSLRQRRISAAMAPAVPVRAGLPPVTDVRSPVFARWVLGRRLIRFPRALLIASSARKEQQGIGPARTRQVAPAPASMDLLPVNRKIADFVPDP